MVHIKSSNIMTGSQFNRVYKKTVFIKLTNISEIHNGFQFKTGLNIDTVPFKPSGSCKAGGIYFCDRNEFFQWHTYNSTVCVNFREVTIPEDAAVYIENDKFKADKLILSEKKSIWNDQLLCEIAIKSSDDAIEYINQTEYLCELAVKKNPDNLKYVKNQTEEICKIAVRMWPYTLFYVKNQTEEICKIAVRIKGDALQYVIKQTPEICKLAIEKSSEAIHFVNNPTKEMYDLVPCHTRLVCKTFNGIHSCFDMIRLLFGN
jgi:hypothetical protein